MRISESDTEFHEFALGETGPSGHTGVSLVHIPSGARFVREGRRGEVSVVRLRAQLIEDLQAFLDEQERAAVRDYVRWLFAVAMTDPDFGLFAERRSVFVNPPSILEWRTYWKSLSIDCPVPPQVEDGR